MEPMPVASPRKILVVDDDVDGAQSFANLIEALGHQAKWTTKPERAMDVARDFAPDLVTLDIGMPGINGYDLAKNLREEFGHAVRLVAVTGHGTDEARARSREAGFDAHVVKPVDMKTLLAILDTLYDMPLRL
jgi:DNA-binding response OmpR family regulator